RLAYEQEGIQTREALARSEAYCRELEVRVALLETHAHRIEWQRQAADDFAVQHIMRTQDLEAEARDDTLEDTDKSWDNDIPAYTNRFQELALICTKFVSNETEKVDKYISILPDNIYGNIKSSNPKTLDDTIELANDLMDQKLRPMRKENLIARERRMTSPETTSKLSRSRMSRKHTTWDLLIKRPMREMRPSAPSANAITLARAL
nr:reverse transcriptase domain-containing protein [Tanacetum cinerariifolium]